MMKQFSSTPGVWYLTGTGSIQLRSCWSPLKSGYKTFKILASRRDISRSLSNPSVEPTSASKQSAVSPPIKWINLGMSTLMTAGNGCKNSWISGWPHQERAPGSVNAASIGESQEHKSWLQSLGAQCQCFGRGDGLGIEPLCGAFLTARLGTPGACAAEEGLEDLFQRSHSTNLLGGTSWMQQDGLGMLTPCQPAQPCQAALLWLLPEGWGTQIKCQILFFFYSQLKPIRPLVWAGHIGARVKTKLFCVLFKAELNYSVFLPEWFKLREEVLDCEEKHFRVEKKSFLTKSISQLLKACLLPAP